MSCSEHHCAEERRRLEHVIERLLTVIDKLLDNRTRIAVSAKGELMPARILVGGFGATFTYRKFDVNGVAVKPLGPVKFASDSPGFATVADDSTQVLNSDNSVSIQVSAVAANADGSDSTAIISGVDPLDGLAGADKLSVGPASTTGGGVATSATGTLTANVAAQARKA